MLLETPNNGKVIGVVVKGIVPDEGITTEKVGPMVGNVAALQVSVPEVTRHVPAKLPEVVFPAEVLPPPQATDIAAATIATTSVSVVIESLHLEFILLTHDNKGTTLPPYPGVVNI